MSEAAHDDRMRGGPPRVEVPSITMPTGGGAVRGIGEKFGTNPANGTGALSIPLTTTPGRGGFGPQLSLAYDSGSGNGPFGVGWSLGLPAVTRRTDRGLPRYRDGEESDVFVLAGAEDLVPVLRDDGARHEDRTRPGWVIHRYRPRVDGAFARLERWTRLADHDVHWRSTSRDNVLTIYGKDARSRVHDPDDPSRVFSWLVCESRDDRGNVLRYGYAAENADGVDVTRPHERVRGPAGDPRRTATRYVTRIHYGNREPVLDAGGRRPAFVDDAVLDGLTWMFEVVFDYDEGRCEPLPPDPARPEADQHRHVRATPAPTRTWAVRPDPFSDYRAGFEIRTYRRCRRVLMFHDIPGGAGGSGYTGLVRATELDYADLDGADVTTVDEELAHPGSTRTASFLRRIVQSGYVRVDGSADAHLERSLPPVDLDYSRAVVDGRLHDVDAQSLENLPIGVDGTSYRWADLDGDGLSGVLTEQAGAWFYKPGLGDGRLGPGTALPTRPSVTGLVEGTTRLLDLAGDGRLDAVRFDGPAGLFERTDDGGWAPFRAFTQLPAGIWSDPDLRFADLDGDGHADAVVAGEDVVRWYPSLGEAGFGPEHTVPRLRGDGPGCGRPAVVDGTDPLLLADMSGDGLADLVHVRNGEVSYCPNLGYGRFGAPVTLDNSPWFDHPEAFDPRRVHLADIDGSGTTDVLYLGVDGPRLYFNQSGNRLSDPRRLAHCPPLDAVGSVTTADLLGNGTACLVWSSPMPGDAGRPMRYVDLMGGQKPHLLVGITNNLGTTTRITYVPSTRFHLADRRAGRPWHTRLPFPVHVVERVTVRDEVGGSRSTTRYAYHDGYFDGVEREFRGFGMVERWDAEEFGATSDPGYPAPPALTRTWFHTGAPGGSGRAAEYYREPGRGDAEAARHRLPGPVLPAGLGPDEEREAHRALRGVMLRQEVYGLDGSDRAATPYTVVEHAVSVVCHQRRGDQRHGVFSTHPRESLTHRHERDPADPQVGHELTLAIDDVGNVLESLSVAYGRRTPSPDPALTDADHAVQARTLVTHTRSRYTAGAVPEAVRADGHHRLPRPAERRTDELTGFVPENGERFTADEWTRDGFALLSSATEIPSHTGEPGAGLHRRTVEHVRTFYRRDDLTGLCPLGTVESMALPGESYQLALTPHLLSSVLVRGGEPLLGDPGGLLESTGPDGGGYVRGDGGWWAGSGRAYFDPDVDHTDPGTTAAHELATARRHFFRTRAVTDPFGRLTRVDHDGVDLLVTRTVDAVGNAVSAVHDYRVLQPRLVTDPNRNRTAVSYDAFGSVAATAARGKPGEGVGDALDGVVADPTPAEVRAFAADPRAAAPSLIGPATTRVVHDLDRFRRTGQPAFAATLSRLAHGRAPDGGVPAVRVGLSFSDGFGREVQRKVQAEPGPAPGRRVQATPPGGEAEPGELVRDGHGHLVHAHTPRRWVGSGRTVFDAKGNPVRRFEPFFSATALYEPEPELTDTGVGVVLFRDPVGRVVAALHPNHTYEKVRIEAWRHVSVDVNDTVREDPRTDPDVGGHVRPYLATAGAGWATWYDERIGGVLGLAAQTAARAAAAHAGTPTHAHLDPLGRAVVTVAHNRLDCPGHPSDGRVERYATRVTLDIEGNQRTVRDAGGTPGPDGTDGPRTVAQYDCDLLGNRVREATVDGGGRWTLRDAAGRPIRTWDSRGVARRLTYDAARRPTGTWVARDAGSERLAERTVYGEERGDAGNHRGEVYRRLDAAGVVTSDRYDFKGNPTRTTRELRTAYDDEVDWSQDQDLTHGTFITSTAYDALNRPIAVTAPDGSVHLPGYSEADLLERVDVRLPGATTTTTFVHDIDHDASGRRTRVELGNGAVTDYTYDPLDQRLARLRTTRPTAPDATASRLFADPAVVQDLRHTYDPIGNITRIDDASLRTVFRDGHRVEPVSTYVYDAVYRLAEARGREHRAQTAFATGPGTSGHRDLPFVGSAHPNDLQDLRTYTERYAYDAVGNIEAFLHRVGGGGWTRRYEYTEPGDLDPGQTSNRLTRTTGGDGVGHSEPYTHDAHGNMTSMPHLAALDWDHDDRLRRVDLGGGGTAYYVHDARGGRVRSIVESRPGVRRWERISLGAVEIYREYRPDGTGVELERETLHVADGGRRIAVVETVTVRDGRPVTRDPVVRHQLANHLGSSCVELDGRGALVSYEEYHPYGTSSFQAGRSAAEVGLKRYRYSGKERDDPTGFYHHGARHYAPWLARWTAVDPVVRQPAAAQGPTGSRSPLLNPYLAMAGNPVTFVDLDGEQDTGYTRYLDRQFATATGSQEVIDNQRSMVAAAATVLSNPKVAGTLQVVGGILELAGAAALLLAPEPTGATKVGGVALGTHGIDTLQAGIRTLASGEVTHTLTHNTAAWTAQKAGASPSTANWIGVGADVVASLGPAGLGALGRAGPAVVAETAAQSSDDVARALFRGTSEGFAGSSGLQRIGVTPASQDPLVATIFATESENYGRGVVQIAGKADLEGVVISEGNVLASLEKEVAVEILPLQFAERAGVQISAADARAILQRMGHTLPPQARGPAGVQQSLASTPRLTQVEIDLFVKEAQLIGAKAVTR